MYTDGTSVTGTVQRGTIMSSTQIVLPPFQDLPEVIRRVRLRDNDASLRLIAYYEPMLRELVSTWLEGTERAGEGTSDFIQSVWGHALPLLNRSENDLHEPGALLSLLLTMVRQKIKEHGERLGSIGGAQVPLDVNMRDDCRPPHGPVDDADLLYKVRAEMPQDIRGFFDLWLSGCSWPKIAEGTGRTPEAIRKDVSRRLGMIAESLDLF